MSGTFSYMVQDNRQTAGALTFAGGMTAIGGTLSDADALLQSEGWACHYTDSTHMELNRPWDNAVTGGSIHPSGNFALYDTANFGVGVGGYYQQTFMHQINTWAMNYAATNVPNSTINNGFAALLPGAAQWFHDVGFDTPTLGSYYGTTSINGNPNLGSCSTGNTPNASPTFLSIHGPSPLPSCGYSGLFGYPPDADGNVEYPERVDSALTYADVVAYKRAQCVLGPSQCTAAIAWGDMVYGAIWGKPAWTTGGVYSDTHYVNISGELSSGSLSFYKWTGFFFGVGMSHQWPAERLSGAPPVTGGPSVQYHGGVGLRGGVH
jgi:hypothetical protein